MAQKKDDIESILDSIDAFMKAGINTKIAQINADKNDSITLKDFDSRAFFYQSMDDRVANYDPFVFFGVSGIEAVPTGPSTIKRITINVSICLVDTEDLLVGKKSLRYLRVLEELFSESWDTIKRGYKFYVKSLPPVSFGLINSSKAYKAVGIDLEFELG